MLRGYITDLEHLLELGRVHLNIETLPLVAIGDESLSVQNVKALLLHFRYELFRTVCFLDKKSHIKLEIVFFNDVFPGKGSGFTCRTLLHLALTFDLCIANAHIFRIAQDLIRSVLHFLNHDEVRVEYESFSNLEEVLLTILINVCHSETAAICHGEVGTFPLGVFHEEFADEPFLSVGPVEGSSVIRM